MEVLKMPNDLLINYRALSEAAAKVKQHRENYDAMIKDFGGNLRKLDDQWSGEAKNQFYTEFEKMEKKLVEFGNTLGAYADALLATVQKGQEMDKEIRVDVEKKLTEFH